ncbi:SEC10/PgrA surface exclusion domain-containing protein [Enterococcus hirae]|uniref:SEC10/PgrA surface exclusion domain-containing protein n=1 Tax=Enterococcus hirae TaxID=1354 RepID=UPI0013770765|nr:SEC10/PgrA surface exclusion domain-containing protein [Enterococcus hirae]NBA38099.1 SEC10/PgrA surface exclusion domain-containing protein [Enterococcus hirae]
MKKTIVTSIGMLTVTGIGVGVANSQVDASELSTEKEVQKAVVQSSTEETVKDKEQQVRTQEKIVQEKQQTLDVAKGTKNQIDQAVKDQQTTVSKNEAVVKSKETMVKDAQQTVDEAKKVVEEATPEAIGKAKDQVTANTQAVVDQQKQVDQAQTDVNQQRTVVNEKKKETNDAKAQNEKDNQATKDAEKELAETKQLAKRAKEEKVKVEQEQRAKEANVVTKTKEEMVAKNQANQDQQAVNKQEVVVSDYEKQVERAKARTEEQQKDLETKKQEVNANQKLTLQAKDKLDQAKEALKGYKGIVLPKNFTPDYYKKLSESEKQALEQEGLTINSVFPANKSDEEKKKIFIDIKNPTSEQKRHISEYGVGILNEVREKMGLKKLSVSNQAIQFAWDVAKYSDPTHYMHDERAINQAAKENGFKQYPGQNFYENLGIGHFSIIDGKVSLYDIEQAFRKLLVNMLLNDGKTYGHLDSLMDPDSVSMAFSISGEGYAGKTHIISFKKDRLLDQSSYEEGTVPVFKTKNQLEQEVTRAEEKWHEAQEKEKQAIQAQEVSAKALNDAKAAQRNLEQELISQQDQLAKLKTVLEKSTMVLASKTKATSDAKVSLMETKARLDKIQALIDNQDNVLQELVKKVDQAKIIEQESAFVLRGLMKEQEVEQAKLNDFTKDLETAKAKVLILQARLANSQRFLSRLEQAQPNYEQALKGLEQAKLEFDLAQNQYQDSVIHLDQLKKEQIQANGRYETAQNELKQAKLLFNQFRESLQQAKTTFMEEKRRAAVEKQVMAEQERLARQTSVQQKMLATTPTLIRNDHQQSAKVNHLNTIEQGKENSTRNLSRITIPTNALPKTGEVKFEQASMFGLLLSMFGITGWLGMRKREQE